SWARRSKTSTPAWSISSTRRMGARCCSAGATERTKSPFITSSKPALPAAARWVRQTAAVAEPCIDSGQKHVRNRDSRVLNGGRGKDLFSQGDGPAQRRHAANHSVL